MFAVIEYYANLSITMYLNVKYFDEKKINLLSLVK